MPNDHFANKTDKSYKDHFSAAAQEGERDPFHGTPLERAEQNAKRVKLEAEHQALINGEPVPTGEGENIHEHDPKVPKDGPTIPDTEQHDS